MVQGRCRYPDIPESGSSPGAFAWYWKGRRIALPGQLVVGGAGACQRQVAGNLDRIHGTAQG